MCVCVCVCVGVQVCVCVCMYVCVCTSQCSAVLKIIAIHCAQLFCFSIHLPSLQKLLVIICLHFCVHFHLSLIISISDFSYS